MQGGGGGGGWMTSVKGGCLGMEVLRLIKEQVHT